MEPILQDAVGLDIGWRNFFTRGNNVINSVAQGTLTLPANDTSFVESLGVVVSSNIVGYTLGSVPLGKVTTDTSTITDIVEEAHALVESAGVGVSFIFTADTELTISSGVITVTQSHHTLDTEGDAATDDLDTINGLVTNQFYFFYPANDARTIVIKHNTGNLLCIGNQDFALNDAHDFIWAFSPDGSTIYVGGPHNAPVFISGTEPTSIQDGQLWLDTAATGTGGLGVLNVTTITGNTTLTDSQTVVLCNAASGSFTVTLPTAVGRDGRHYTIKKIDATANTVTIDGDGSETIDDGTTTVLTVQHESITIVSDGTAWFIL